MVNQTSRVLLPLAFIFLCLEVAGYLFPTGLTWGFHSYGFLPAWYLTAAIIFTLLATAILARIDIGPFIRRLAGYSEKHGGFFLGLIVVLFLGVTVLLRVNAPLLGDGFFLVKNFSDAFHGTAPLYFRDEPLATAFFWIIFVVIGEPATYREFLQGFLIADCILAVSFILIVHVILKLFITDPKARLLGFLLVLVLPSMQLFFGYVETYAVALVALSLYVLAAALHIQKGKSFTLVTVAFLLMALTHYMTVVILPSLLFLAHREYRRSGWKSVVVAFGTVALIVLGILVANNFDVSQYYSYVPQHHYLSLMLPEDAINAESQAYTLLSPFHLIDLGNLLILIGLPVIFLLGLSVPESRWRIVPRTDGMRFLVAALVPILLTLAIIKFDLGAARDWDVFAPFAVLAILFAILVIGERTDGPILNGWALAVVLTLLHSISYWSVNASADSTLARYDTLLDTRTVSQGGYYAASLHLAQYHLQMKNDSLAIEAWKRFNRNFPDDLRGYENLVTGWIQSGHAKVEEITGAYGQWLARAPADTALRLVYRNFCLNLGNSYFKNGELTDAARFYEKAISIDSTYPNAHNNLGSVYAQEGNLDSAMREFQRAIILNPSYGEAYYNLGNVLSDKGKAKLARDCYQKAALLNVAEAKDILQESKKSE